MDPIITGSLILGGVSALSNIASYGANRNLTQKMWEEQKEYNTAEREAAQAYNTSERLAVQDYNSPKSQMERLMSAGINPNTAAGMVSSPNSNAQSISGATASPTIADMASPFGDMAYYAHQASQIRLTNAQAQRQETENKYLDSIFQLNQDQIKETINNIKADTSYKSALRELTESQRTQVDEMLPLLVRQSEEEIKQLEQAISLYEEQIKNAQKERDVMDSQITLNQSQASANYAQAGLLNEQQKEELWENECRAVGIDPKGKVSKGILSILAHPKTGPNVARGIISTIKENVSAAQDIYKDDIKPFFNKAKDFLSPLWNK